MMNFRHLKYFVAVAEELSFTRAAERLNMAQPPLSQQIKQLEDELDTVLIERGSRPLRLTRAGEAMLRHANRILEMSKEAKADVGRIGKGQTGILNVGFVGSALFSILPEILTEFHQQFPKVDVSLNEMLAGQTGNALQNRKVDVGIVRPALQATDGFEQIPLINERLVLAVPKDHPIAGRDRVPLTDLSSEPFILYPRYPKPSLTDDVLIAFHEIGVQPEIIQEVLHLQTALILVAQGVGLTFVAQSVARQPRDGVVFLNDAETAPISALSLVWRRDEASPALDGFLRISREQAMLYSTHQILPG